MTRWLTADTHFGHTNIIKFCHRPFLKPDGSPDVVLMNETLIANWNGKVKPDDEITVVGDFFLGPVENVPPLLDRLQGKITLVRGNHDTDNKVKLYQSRGIVVVEALITMHGSYRVQIAHHPAMSRLDCAAADVIVCGHVHELWTTLDRNINVGVDVRSFAPIAWEEIL